MLFLLRLLSVALDTVNGFFRLLYFVSGPWKWLLWECKTTTTTIVAATTTKTTATAAQWSRRRFLTVRVWFTLLGLIRSSRKCHFRELLFGLRLFFRSLAHKRRLEPSSLRTKHEKLFNEPGFRAFWPRKAKPGDKDKGEEGLCGRCYKIKTSLKREKGTSVFFGAILFSFFLRLFPQ